jgi:hypothetical protein
VITDEEFEHLCGFFDDLYSVGMNEENLTELLKEELEIWRWLRSLRIGGGGA